MARAKQRFGGTRGRRKKEPARTKIRSKSKAKSAVLIEASQPVTDIAMDVDASRQMTVEVEAAAPSSSEDGRMMLPDCLDSSAAPLLKDMLLTRRGNSIVIDASEVRRVGVQSLQVLVAAARTWQSDGQSYRMTNASTELLDTVALVGLPHEDLLLEGSNQ